MTPTRNENILKEEPMQTYENHNFSQVTAASQLRAVTLASDTLIHK